MMIQTRRRAKSPRWRLETAAAERLFEQKLLPTTSSSKRYVTVSQPVLIHDKNPKVIGLPENYKKLVSHLLCSPIRREGGGISRPRMWKENPASFFNSVRPERDHDYKRTCVDTCANPFGFVFTIRAQQFGLESGGWGLGKQQEQCMLVFVGLSSVWP